MLGDKTLYFFRSTRPLDVLTYAVRGEVPEPDSQAHTGSKETKAAKSLSSRKRLYTNEDAKVQHGRD